ncbi:MAG: isocitrate/isopropylmalate dehydrogenase family protein [Deltaproteobacteria bacterium]|nr:isocitrate/isopropylmalate dehydrogenase family protein [Deltaproteobacteria bacterium]
MHKITLIPGDGIGREISEAAKLVIEAAGVKINWDIVDAGAECIEKKGTPLPEDVLDSVKKNRVALKGPITTPIGTGFRSVNVSLRKQLNLFANLRPAKTIKGVKSRYEDVDLIVVRENTEDLYAGIERQIDKDTAETIKIITRKASEQISEFAFEYAKNENRKKVTAVTKANICKLTDGLFLEASKKIAEKYPEIEYEEILVDNLCMKLVRDPSLFDILLLPNLYGDIISDLTAGLIGGLGIAPGANIGENIAVFEPVHGSAPKMAGANKADPTAIILSGVLMLKYIQETEAADNIYKAVCEVIGEGKNVTYDLGGNATTMQMAEAIAKKL